MTTTTTNSPVTGNGQWQTVYEDTLHGILARWSDENKTALDNALTSFLDKDGEGMAPQAGEGWYGTESPFSYTLRWRAEDLMKAEVTAWVAGALQHWMTQDESLTGSQLLEFVAAGLDEMQAKGLRATSSSQMSNVLDQMRGYAALDWGSFGSGPESWKWEAYYKTLSTLADDERKEFDSARRLLKDANYKLGRAKAESTLARVAEQVRVCQKNLNSARFALSAKLVDFGAPEWVVDQATKDTPY